MTTPSPRTVSVRRPLIAVLLAVATALVASLLLPASPASAAAGYTFTPVLSGLASPVQVVSFPDGSGRVAIVEKRGSVRVMRGGKLLSGFYFSLGDRVTTNAGISSSEQGLLGLEFGPSFATNPVLFVSYVRQDGALVVSKLRAFKATSPNIRVGTETVLLTIPHPTYTNHNGGSLTFGKDKLLYIATGDGGGAGDPLDVARRRDSLQGKILRVDAYRTCGSTPYCIPDGNPFKWSTDKRKEVFAWGLRNPWRTSVDPVTGNLWIADVGQDAAEEVTVIPPGSPSGSNLGWPCREGFTTYDSGRCVSGALYRQPVVDYCHSDAVGCPAELSGKSVTGGEVYRGSVHTDLVGDYIFGDFISGNVWQLDGTTMVNIASLPYVTDFGRAPNGELLGVTYGGTLARLDVG